MINVAIVGLGKMGLSHLAILNALDAFNVVAICDNTPLVGKVISKYSGLKYVSDYNDLLTLPDLQAVVIATPSIAHVDMVKKALERGLHVFCEKPLTLSGTDSTYLVDLANQHNCVTQVGYHNRFIGTFHEGKKLVDSGALGKVHHVLAEAYGPVVLKPAKPTWRGKADQGGGCLYDYAAHPLNLMNWYFGQSSSVDAALLKRGFSSEVDDQVYATMKFDHGVTGQLSVDWSDHSVRKMTTRLTIWGDSGKLYIDRQELQFFAAGTAAIPDGYKRGWTVKYITDLTPPVSYYLRGEEYSAQLEAFAAAISARAGNRNDFTSAAQTDSTIAMIRDTAAGRTAASGPAPAPVAQPAGVLGRLFGR